MNFGIQVASDVRKILSSDFAGDVTFTPPLGAPVTVTGYRSKHYMEVDQNGFVSVSGKKAHVTVPIGALVDAGYITRNTAGNLLSFEKHLVTFTDGTGQVKTYIIQPGESAADEDLGTIRFVLGYYNAGTPPARTIYGYMPTRVYANVTDTLPIPNPNQTLDNGDQIPLYYVLNVDGTLTIPYLVQYANCGFLQPFIINFSDVPDIVYDATTGTFNNDAHGGFNNSSEIEFNARVPIFILP